MFRRRLFTSRRDKATISSVTFGHFSSKSHNQKPNKFTSTATAMAASALPLNSLPTNSHNKCQESPEEAVASSINLNNNHYERRPSVKHTRRFRCPSASMQFWQSALNALRALIAVFSQVKQWLPSRRNLLFAIALCSVVAIAMGSAVEVPSISRDSGVEHTLMLLSASILPQGDRFVCKNT